VALRPGPPHEIFAAHLVGIWRKPGGPFLMFLQISVAFALFGVLQGSRRASEHLVAAARWPTC